ncbi:hypothetical protein C8Q77DRAFT_320639 [Trametes polyzona]|nr:hypothetical protein C8Q77DRAFT_320639 [Trametes polyzona]
MITAPRSVAPALPVQQSPVLRPVSHSHVRRPALLRRPSLDLGRCAPTYSLVHPLSPQPSNEGAWSGRPSPIHKATELVFPCLSGFLSLVTAFPAPSTSANRRGFFPAMQALRCMPRVMQPQLSVSRVRPVRIAITASPQPRLRSLRAQTVGPGLSQCHRRVSQKLAARSPPISSHLPDPPDFRTVLPALVRTALGFSERSCTTTYTSRRSIARSRTRTIAFSEFSLFAQCVRVPPFESDSDSAVCGGPFPKAGTTRSRPPSAPYHMLNLWTDLRSRSSSPPPAKWRCCHLDRLD